MAKNNKQKQPKKEHTQPNGQTFYTVANQKDILVMKPKSRSPFFQIDEKYMFDAMQNLNGGAYKIWCYLASNMNKYNFALSYNAVGRKTGVSKDTYDRSIKELKEKGYLIQHKDTNHYYFIPDNTRRGGMSLEDYFMWCDKTNESGYKWTDEDYSDYEDVDENIDGWWKSDKFEYNY